MTNGGNPFSDCILSGTEPEQKTHTSFPLRDSNPKRRYVSAIFVPLSRFFEPDKNKASSMRICALFYGHFSLHALFASAPPARPKDESHMFSIRTQFEYRTVRRVVNPLNNASILSEEADGRGNPFQVRAHDKQNPENPIARHCAPSDYREMLCFRKIQTFCCAQLAKLEPRKLLDKSNLLHMRRR